MPKNYYDTDRGAAEYLWLHYGAGGRGAGGKLPPALRAAGALDFPARCAREALRGLRLPEGARALELGCAVGRASFGLARRGAEVVGVDYSRRFIALARRLRRDGAVDYALATEGQLTTTARAVVPRGIDRARVRFLRGDAMNPPPGLGVFDVVLLANLLCRLRDPRRCLAQLPALVAPGGRLVITTPGTWAGGHTPRKNWLGGFTRAGRAVTTLATLRELLSPHFRLVRRLELPFLLREHARKYQLGLAEATVWRRR